ncbi:MAG TPA: hypothetical protein VF741_08555 [Candidatus Aquilonibacter sp.]
MLTALALTVNLATPTPTPSSAESFYAAALQNMRHTRQPALVEYRATIFVPYGEVIVNREPGGDLYLAIGQGNAGTPEATFSLRVPDTGHTYGVELDPKHVARARLPMLNATWQGIDDWIRYGFDGYPDTDSSPPSASPAPDTGNLKVIAAVSSFGLAYYRATDGPDESCANGDAGHVINLAPLGDPYAHPLRSVTIDRADGLFCTVHLIAPARDPGYTSIAYVALHLGEVSGYCFVLDEAIDLFATAPMRADQRSHATITFSNFVIANP